MSTELVGIELQLKGYDGVMSDFRALDQMLNSFRGKKNRIEIQSDLANAKRELTALRGEMNKLKDDASAVKALMRDGIIPKEDGKAALESIQNEMDEVAKKTRDASQRVRELQLALRQFSQMSFGQMFNKISSTVAHMGSAMQSAGNALTRLTNPFANFTKGIVMGAGYQALNKFTSGLENGFNRYDTMKKYPKIMEAFGYSNEEAQKSIEALDMSVRGLPTGLDEMVDLAQRFTATTGDIEKGTKLAIATNNAFLASMSTDTQKYQGMMQLQDVLGGKDMNAREWNSLVSSMTPAIVKMGESLGYTKDNMSEFIQTIRDGKMDNQEFIDQLIKIGNEGGVLESMAQESKNTWQAFFANVGNAASRMTAGIIQSLDEVSRAVVGKDVNQFLAENVIGGIDNMTASIKNWVKAHPEEITDFFKSLGDINWSSIIKGFGEAMLGVADLTKTFADMFGGKDLSWLGKFMIYGNVLGKFLTIAGGLLKGSRGIIAFLGAGGFKGIQAIRNIKKAGGIMGWLGTLAVGDDAKKTEETIETVAKTSGKMGKFSSGLSSIFKGWTQVAAMIGGSAFVAWGSMKLFKGAMSSFKEMVDIIKDIDWDTGAEALIGIGAFLTAMGGLSALAGGNVGAGVELLIGEVIVGLFTTLATGFAAIDMALIKSSFKSFADSIKYLKSGLAELEDLKSFSSKGVADKIGDAIEVFNAVTTLFKGDFNADTKQWENGLKHFDKDFANSIKDLKTAIGAINDISKMNIDTSNISVVTEQVANALIALDSMLQQIPEGMGTEGTSDTTANLSSTISNLKASFDSLIGKDGIMGQIASFIQQSQGYGESGTYETFVTRMQEVGNALKSAYDALNQGLGNGEFMSTNMDGLRQALKSTKFAMEHFNEIGDIEINSGSLSNINSFVSSIKQAFDASVIEGIQTQVRNFADSIKTALQALKDIGNEPIEIDAEVKLSSGFYSSVSDVVSDINDAADDIRSAFRNIPSSLFKTIFVTLSASVDTSGAVSAINAAGSYVKSIADSWSANLNSATGGRISRAGVLYRSGGGSIFRPRGTDKIPAMLTEGEYVHKKQAVDFFGLDFMRSVNNMDVRGAMQALLTRAGTTVGVGRQSIFNHTVNNNQKIVQNISTNNPNFANVQMGRFVGAL